MSQSQPPSNCFHQPFGIIPRAVTGWRPLQPIKHARVGKLAEAGSEPIPAGDGKHRLDGSHIGESAGPVTVRHATIAPRNTSRPQYFVQCRNDVRCADAV